MRDPVIKLILRELGKVKNATNEKAKRVLGWTPFERGSHRRHRGKPRAAQPLDGQPDKSRLIKLRSRFLLRDRSKSIAYAGK